jgi:hypothetical protein
MKPALIPLAMLAILGTACSGKTSLVFISGGGVITRRLLKNPNFYLKE